MAFADEVSIGILTSLVYDALKRPYKGLRDVVTKRRKIAAALDSKLAKPGGKADEAFGDLIRVIGGVRGQYTESVALFLRELERSAVPEAMQNFALCGRSAASLFTAFDVIYQSCAPLPFTSRGAFDALYTAMKLRIEQSTDDPALLEALQAQGTEIMRQLEAVENALKNAPHLGSSISINALVEARQKLSRAIESTSRYIHVETTQGTRKVHLNKIIIPARLTRHATLDSVASVRNELDSHSITFDAFRRSFHRAIILGDPGGGKSTLTQYLSHTLSANINQEAASTNSRKYDSMDLKLPLRVVLRTLQSRQQKNPSYSILDYLEDDLRSALNNDSTTARAFLKQTLALGQAVLIFDGLDEALEVESRRALVSAVEQFATIYTACPVLVTSRIVGYRDAPLSPDFDTYTLAKFNRDEVSKFSEKLIYTVGGLSTTEAKKRAHRFVTQTETVAGDLRPNPLLLGLMVYIFMNKGDVPDNRPEIYQECSLLMFEKWDKNRDIVFEFPRDFNLLDLFGFLAERIFGDPDAEEGVSEDWLLSTMRQFFEGWYEDRAKAVTAARVLVEFITGRAWVMCDIGPKMFKFTHRTFLEYFVARRIQEQCGSISMLISGTLLAKISRGEWDVVAHLALQIATFRSGPRSMQAYDALLGQIALGTLSPAEEEHFLKFVARAFQYISIPESKLRAATRLIATRTVSLCDVCNFSIADVLRLLIRNAKSREDMVADEARSVFEPIIAAQDGGRRRFCFYFGGTRDPVFQENTAGELEFKSMGAVWDAFAAARENAKSTQLEKAKVDKEEAVLYTYIYGDSLRELYSVHGLDLFVMPTSKTRPRESEFLGCRMLVNAMSTFTDDVWPSFDELNPESCLATIRAISQDAFLGRFRTFSPASISRTTRFGDASEILRLFQRRVINVISSARTPKRTLEELMPLIITSFVLSEIELKQHQPGSPVGERAAHFVNSSARVWTSYAERLGNPLERRIILDWSLGRHEFVGDATSMIRATEEIPF